MFCHKLHNPHDQIRNTFLYRQRHKKLPRIFGYLDNNDMLRIPILNKLFYIKTNLLNYFVFFIY